MSSTSSSTSADASPPPGSVRKIRVFAHDDQVVKEKVDEAITRDPARFAQWVLLQCHRYGVSPLTREVIHDWALYQCRADPERLRKYQKKLKKQPVHIPALLFNKKGELVADGKHCAEVYLTQPVADNDLTETDTGSDDEDEPGASFEDDFEDSYVAETSSASTAAAAAETSSGLPILGVLEEEVAQKVPRARKHLRRERKRVKVRKPDGSVQRLKLKGDWSKWTLGQLRSGLEEGKHLFVRGFYVDAAFPDDTPLRSFGIWPGTEVEMTDRRPLFHRGDPSTVPLAPIEALEEKQRIAGCNGYDWTAHAALPHVRDPQQVADIISSTSRILSTRPSSPKEMLPHILAGCARQSGRDVLFYNGGATTSGVGDRHGDVLQYTALGDVGSEMELVLDESFDDWKRCDETQETCRARIARALGVEENRVQLVSISRGSVAVRFTVSALSAEERQRIRTQWSERFKQEFDTFEQLCIHPLFFAHAYDLDVFDAQWDYDFTQLASHPEQKRGDRKYFQPAGALQYGLKVLGLYSDDVWVKADASGHPRAYHATGAHHEIVHQANDTGVGFIPSGGGKLGAGVYLSPYFEYAAIRYGSAKSTVTLSDGSVRTYVVVLQCCVDPAGITRTGYPSSQFAAGTFGSPSYLEYSNNDDLEWLVPNPAHVRPYKVCVAEQGRLNHIRNTGSNAGYPG
eukprot:TRINITY_DN13671_c0_g1_i1.p1 TRINITY_DN13671_c0_g1~~TRINITY_DN13671_c0_g1_i1.p1  ORF type:complete len:735 (+),score=211.64 TRINITY_DN13671_c0_g1_i1:149-2206(+)